MAPNKENIVPTNVYFEKRAVHCTVEKGTSLKIDLLIINYWK
ncbi:hypothetical protein ACFSFY_14645 [Sporosarcina siberiensis]|uniref:Uncharacterized protein n=1 Tax=Sporosarcina siberiensis TaxID=1365606 RepID=A0ABW4SI84_9BACL